MCQKRMTGRHLVTDIFIVTRSSPRRLMLMALYNVSISVKGLKYISENSGFLPLIWTLLDGELADGKRTGSIIQGLENGGQRIPGVFSFRTEGTSWI